MTREATVFKAVLVFAYQDGGFGSEICLYAAVHPEIAYAKALAYGAELRYGGRQLLGLAELCEAEADDEAIGQLMAVPLPVLSKHELTVFQAARWAEPVDPAVLAEALREPPLLFEPEGIDEVPWHELSHAYGPAIDVPRCLRALASSDAGVRDQALWELEGSIYHQGDLCDASAPAVKIMLPLIARPELPNRGEILGFLAEIAASCGEPELVRRGWQQRIAAFPKFHAHLTAQDIERFVQDVVDVRQAFRGCQPLVAPFSQDPDPELRQAAAAILELLAEL